MGLPLKTFKKYNKALASLKLAVFVILAIGVLSAWGTIVESMYQDAKRAQETVYHSWYSYGIFSLLTLNLVAVIIDRYPWRRQHLGFISAHVGIIILILGSLMTRYFGIDGSMAFALKESQKRVSLGATDLVVYSGLMDTKMRKTYEQEVNFLVHPPSEKTPYQIPLGGESLVINGFEPYTIPEMKIVASDKKAHGSALRFQMANERVSESDWLFMGQEPFQVKNMGPAQIVLAQKNQYRYSGGHVLLIEINPPSQVMNYVVFKAAPKGSGKKGKRTAKGRIKLGEPIQTGWMGLSFRVLKFLPRAQKSWSYQPLEQASEGTTQAIRFLFKDKEYWTGLNSSVRLFSDQAFHVLVFANRQKPLDFSLRLDEFRVGRYQGTLRASSYESDVTLLDAKGQALKKTTISMNEPLYHRGFTFYQSSFQEDERGQPTMSILSVNRDPGRPWKYLGSLLIVMGIIHLFYFKKRRGVA